MDNNGPVRNAAVVLNSTLARIGNSQLRAAVLEATQEYARVLLKEERQRCADWAKFGDALIENGIRTGATSPWPF
jgi:hypothetical protein